MGWHFDSTVSRIRDTRAATGNDPFDSFALFSQAMDLRAFTLAFHWLPGSISTALDEGWVLLPVTRHLLELETSGNTYESPFILRSSLRSNVAVRAWPVRRHLVELLPWAKI